MSVDPLNIGASGLTAYSDALDVSANNVANVDSTGFQLQNVNLQNQAGGGVTVATITSSSAQGSLEPSDQSTNLAISGSGFFVEQGGDGEPIYTRDGNFSLDANGTLVDPSTGLDVMTVTSTGGVAPLQIPPGVQSISFGLNGAIYGVLADGQLTSLGTVALARFNNAGGLRRVSGGYEATAASGVAQVGRAGTAGFGTLISGMVEGSNVDLGGEFVKMTAAKTAFDANAKTVEVASAMDRTVDGLIS
ncbi:MAG: flagellar hook basal-body protein [Vulcanimicrobiaceae bacterium]